MLQGKAKTGFRPLGGKMHFVSCEFSFPNNCLCYAQWPMVELCTCLWELGNRSIWIHASQDTTHVWSAGVGVVG